MAKTRARNAKGQFQKKSSHRRSKSKALARRGSTAVAKRSHGSRSVARRGSTQVKRRRRHGGTFSGGGVLNGTIRELKGMAPELIADAAYAYVTLAPATNAAGETSLAAKLREYLDKVPTWDKIGRPASHGVLGIGVAIALGGKFRRPLGLFAKAALHVAAHNLGVVAFDYEQAATMAGDGGAESVHLAGEVTDAEVMED